MMRLILHRVLAILQEELYRCLSWQKLLKLTHPDLYARLLEEARWGLNWLLGTRFGDGYRDGGMIVGIWTDNVTGTKDDMETKATNDPFDNFISSIATALAVPYYDSVDPVFSAWCRKAAMEDYDFATEI